MKLAVGRCPESGEALASQSTISRLENAPRKTDYLQSEVERIRRDAARYAHLTQSASSSVKMISEGMEKWRKTDLPVPG